MCRESGAGREASSNCVEIYEDPPRGERNQPDLNSPTWTYDGGAPIFHAMTAAAAVERHRAEVLRLAAKYGATDVRVFGSVARGDADVSSDIDFVVRMSPGRSLFDLGGLLMDLQDLLGRRVDVVTERGLRPRMRERVLREAVPV